MAASEPDDEVAAIVRRIKSRDPDVFAIDMARIAAAIPSGRRVAVGLDPATSCGYCVTWFRAGVPYDPRADFTVMGQLDLSAGPYDSGAIRFVRLRQFLEILRPNLVCYEEPKVTPPEAVTRFNANAIVARAATAMELIGGLKTTICAWAEERSVPCQGVPIGTIKKRATGRGNAGKPEVIAGVNAIFGTDLDPEGYESSGHDNIADAAACLLVGMSLYGMGVA